MKPIPYRDNLLYNQNFLNENRLCALRNHVTSAALENSDGVQPYMNIVRLTRTFEIKGQAVSALDFITKNTMDPSYTEANPSQTLNFGNGNITYVALQAEFSALFEGVRLPPLAQLIKDWKNTYNNAQERRNLELSFLKPTNIENVAYKFREVFAYNNAPLWTYIQNSSGSVRTRSFMTDPNLAKYMLDSLMQCQPDSLLLSILTSIKDELDRNDNETQTQKEKRQEACSTLSKVCDALQKYYNDSNQQANLSASFGEIANADSGMGFLPSASGISNDVLRNFGRLSGGEKAISLIGALVLGRAIGHNFPRVNAAIKTSIVAALGAPMLAHLGTKFMYGRSYMEVRKIKALLGGSNTKNPQQVIARICGFSLEEAKTPGVVNSMESFIDSMVGNEVFASLPFRDVIMTFAPQESPTTDLIPASSSSAVLGALTAYPKIKASLELVIPQLVNKYENNKLNPYEKAKFHIALSSSRTWVEGMHFLMSNSAELESYYDQDPLESKVMQQSEIRHTSNLEAMDDGLKRGYLDEEIQATSPDEQKEHISHDVGSSIEDYVAGHYYAPFLRESTTITHNTSNLTIPSFDYSSDAFNHYASFSVENFPTTNRAAILKAYLDAIKNKIQTASTVPGQPDTMKLIFSGPGTTGDSYHFAITWRKKPAPAAGKPDWFKTWRSQLISLDTATYGTPTLNLYTEFFRSHDIQESSILDAIKDPNSLTVTKINEWLPEGAKLATTTDISFIKTALSGINSFFPKTMNFISFLLSKKPKEAIAILNSRGTALSKVSRLLVLLRSPIENDTSVKTEHERRLEILNYYLDKTKEHVQSLNLNDTALDRANVWAESFALGFACREINGGSRYDKRKFATFYNRTVTAVYFNRQTIN